MEKVLGQARRDIPAEANEDGNSVNQLVWNALTELDLVIEGQGHYEDMDGRTKRGIKIRLKKFVKKYAKYSPDKEYLLNQL